MLSSVTARVHRRRGLGSLFYAITLAYPHSRGETQNLRSGRTLPKPRPSRSLSISLFGLGAFVNLPCRPSSASTDPVECHGLQCPRQVLISTFALASFAAARSRMQIGSHSRSRRHFSVLTSPELISSSPPKADLENMGMIEAEEL